MKQFVTIALLALLTFSFLGEAGIIPLEKKATVELSEDLDLDGEKEGKTKSEKDKFASSSIFKAPHILATKYQSGYPLTTNLLHASYEVEIRPPRA